MLSILRVHASICSAVFTLLCSLNLHELQLHVPLSFVFHLQLHLLLIVFIAFFRIVCSFISMF